jgi:hypothetical protein
MARLQDQHGMSDAAVDGMARGQEYVRTTRARGVGLVLEGDWLSCPPPPPSRAPLDCFTVLTPQRAPLARPVYPTACQLARQGG